MSYADKNSTIGRSNEAKLLESLRSPYIIEYIECFIERFSFHLVTEYCKV